MSDSATTQQPPDTPSPTSSQPPSSAPEFWFVATCLIVPVLWGVVVHRIFRRLQDLQKPADDDSVWPDYQI